MASRSPCGSIFVLVTTSVIEEPTRPWFGVVPLFSTSAICCSDQSPIRVGVMFGKSSDVREQLTGHHTRASASRTVEPCQNQKSRRE